MQGLVYADVSSGQITELARDSAFVNLKYSLLFSSVGGLGGIPFVAERQERAWECSPATVLRPATLLELLQSPWPQCPPIQLARTRAYLRC